MSEETPVNTEETKTEEVQDESKVEETQPEEPKTEEPEPKTEEPEPKTEEPEPKTEEPEPKAEEPEPKAEEPEPKAEEPEPKAKEPEPKTEEPEAKTEEPEPKTEEPEPKTEDPALEEPEPAPKPSRPPRTKLYSTNPSEPVDLCMGDSGLTALEPYTVGKLFRNIKENYGNNRALAFKEAGEYKFMTYNEYYDQSVAVAKSFLKLELEPFCGVGIIGFNSPEWVLSLFGAIFAGGLAAGIYTTSSPESCQYVLNDCKANIVVVENDKQLQKILKVRDSLPHLKAIVQYKDKLTESYPDVYEWAQFLELGNSIDTKIIEDKISNLNPGHCCSLIYTSGTTGNPKGVMLSHDNVTWTVESFAKTYTDVRYGCERAITYLPLSHIAAQLSDIFIMMFCGGVTYFAQPDALKGSLRDSLLECKPTMFFAVPRVWEKFMAAIKASAPAGGLKQKLSSWARDKAFTGHYNVMEGGSHPWGWTIASMLLKKPREALGFTETKVLATAAAPMRREVLDFFVSLNMPLCDLIGMSETTGPAIANVIEPGRYKFGSIGKPLAGVEVKLDYDASPEEGQGEICYRGRSVMMGYYGNEEKTKDCMDSEGWLHSGDLARVDEEGFYFISGRIKELIITSGGENVAPVPIEDRIKAQLPYVSQVFIVGEQRNFLSCLITLQSIVDADTQESTDELTPEAIKHISLLGSSATKVSQVIENQDRAVFEAIQKGVDKANEEAVSNAQKIQKWTILDCDFSVAGGELGPTLKLKRFFILQKYKETIEGMYNQPKPQ